MVMFHNHKMFISAQHILNVRHLTKYETRRCLSDCESNFHIFKNFFGLHQQKARDYIQKHKLALVEPAAIMKVTSYCEQRGYTKDEILKNPGILRMPLSTIDQYYSVMLEGGFYNITIKSIAKFRSLYRKTIHTLKEFHFIEEKTNVASSFIRHLNPRPDDFQVKTCGDSDLWCNVHLRILIEYLKWRLKVTDDEISKFLKVHPTIQRKSFQSICHNINFAEELGFAPAQVLKNGYMLRAYPQYVQEIVERFPELAGVPIKQAMRMYPKLTTASATNMEKIYGMLREHNIPETAIAKRLSVFYLAPDTVEFRLKELERVDDFKVLLHHPNILKLVVHHNRAKSRLLFLKDLQLKCATVALLGDKAERFDSHIKEGRDVNGFNDTFSFLKGIFMTDVHEFEDILRKHPYYRQVPLTQMEESHRFLTREGFTNTAILKNICILLYPKEKIKSSLEQVRAHEIRTNERSTQMEKLNMALYFIEKENHFSGDGIWLRSEVSEESVHSG